MMTLASAYLRSGEDPSTGDSLFLLLLCQLIIVATVAAMSGRLVCTDREVRKMSTHFRPDSEGTTGVMEGCHSGPMCRTSSKGMATLLKKMNPFVVVVAAARVIALI
jgi:hypothetical protein